MLNFINYYLLQLFFIRLTKHYQGNKLNYWSVQFFVVPMSGYGKPFKHVFLKRFWRITKRRFDNE